MKQRPKAHVIDTVGERLLRAALPPTWVIRTYQPDYGIDFDVEVFDTRDGDTVSLGEHFFIQLKSHIKAKWATKRVFGRYNIEKSPLQVNPDDAREIQVVAEPLGRQELQLARSMGPATPLVLVVADTSNSTLHWVCLNDFVDKVLIPEVGDLSSRAKHTVHLPRWNKVAQEDSALIPLRFFARRAKLYAAFNRFRYHRHEIQRATDGYRALDGRPGAEEELIHLAHHFLSAALAYDFWKTTHAWPAIELSHMQLEVTADLVARVRGGESIKSALGARMHKSPVSEEDAAYWGFLLVSEINSMFDQLANLGNMFEEICREWYLPTLLGDLAEENSLR